MSTAGVKKGIPVTVTISTEIGKYACEHSLEGAMTRYCDRTDIWGERTRKAVRSLILKYYLKIKNNVVMDKRVSRMITGDKFGPNQFFLEDHENGDLIKLILKEMPRKGNKNIFILQKPRDFQIDRSGIVLLSSVAAIFPVEYRVSNASAETVTTDCTSSASEDSDATTLPGPRSTNFGGTFSEMSRHMSAHAQNVLQPLLNELSDLESYIDSNDASAAERATVKYYEKIIFENVHSTQSENKSYSVFILRIRVTDFDKWNIRLLKYAAVLVSLDSSHQKFLVPADLCTPSGLYTATCKFLTHNWNRKDCFDDEDDKATPLEIFKRRNSSRTAECFHSDSLESQRSLKAVYMKAHNESSIVTNKSAVFSSELEFFVIAKLLGITIHVFKSTKNNSSFTWRSHGSRDRRTCIYIGEHDADVFYGSYQRCTVKKIRTGGKTGTRYTAAATMTGTELKFSDY